ncbi:MAG: hypothetical protein COU25_02070 [Candidatus Levybacteria bacterium CG10_big_fil_rev_8_21_14_0_10_35_13]|nr:MAG: hypothetical protein COU25_02070 [Candidatus Levybacteria bacterium CG10_big_fil_rev_8_21_14_0_10_35_13]
MANKPLSKVIRETDKNLIETGVGLASTVTKSVKDELSEEWRISVRQMLGIEERAQNAINQAEGELKEGEEVSFSKKEKRAEIEPGIDYRSEIIHAETRHIQTENRELKQRIEEIKVELVRIKESSKELETTFKAVTVETLQTPAEVGKYHVGFLEWMLSALQNARIRIESSASWIGVIAGKKSKKDYWSLAKSHGTSFSLSGERVVAQQTG